MVFYCDFHEKIVPLFATLSTQKVMKSESLKVLLNRKLIFPKVLQNELQKFDQIDTSSFQKTFRFSYTSYNFMTKLMEIFRIQSETDNFRLTFHENIQ